MCLGTQKFSAAKQRIKVRPAGDRTQSSQCCMNLLLFLPRQTHTPSCEQIMLASKIGWQSWPLKMKSTIHRMVKGMKSTFKKWPVSRLLMPSHFTSHHVFGGIWMERQHREVRQNRRRWLLNQTNTGSNPGFAPRCLTRDRWQTSLSLRFFCKIEIIRNSSQRLVKFRGHRMVKCFTLD